jgi:hypothetical protein
VKDPLKTLLLESGQMRVVRISNPLLNPESWFYVAVGAIFWALARWLEPSQGAAVLHGVWLPPCPLKALSGIPCPFCGLTTGIAWLARWHWPEAWHSNILSPVVALLSIALVAYSLAFRLLSGTVLDLELSIRARQRLWLAGGFLVALSWLVNLLRIY